jgi:hypothetical protein
MFVLIIKYPPWEGLQTGPWEGPGVGVTIHRIARAGDADPGSLEGGGEEKRNSFRSRSYHPNREGA